MRDMIGPSNHVHIPLMEQDYVVQPAHHCHMAKEYLSICLYENCMANQDIAKIGAATHVNKPGMLLQQSPLHILTQKVVLCIYNTER